MGNKVYQDLTENVRTAPRSEEGIYSTDIALHRSKGDGLGVQGIPGLHGGSTIRETVTCTTGRSNNINDKRGWRTSPQRRNLGCLLSNPARINLPRTQRGKQVTTPKAFLMRNVPSSRLSRQSFRMVTSGRKVSQMVRLATIHRRRRMRILPRITQ